MTHAKLRIYISNLDRILVIIKGEDLSTDITSPAESRITEFADEEYRPNFTDEEIGLLTQKRTQRSSRAVSKIPHPTMGQMGAMPVWSSDLSKKGKIEDIARNSDDISIQLSGEFYETRILNRLESLQGDLLWVCRGMLSVFWYTIRGIYISRECHLFNATIDIILYMDAIRIEGGSWNSSKLSFGSPVYVKKLWNRRSDI